MLFIKSIIWQIVRMHAMLTQIRKVFQTELSYIAATPLLLKWRKSVAGKNSPVCMSENVCGEFAACSQIRVKKI